MRRFVGYSGEIENKYKKKDSYMISKEYIIENK
jgi:hypothetical protein